MLFLLLPPHFLGHAIASRSDSERSRGGAGLAPARLRLAVGIGVCFNHRDVNVLIQRSRRSFVGVLALQMP